MQRCNYNQGDGLEQWALARNRFNYTLPVMPSEFDLNNIHGGVWQANKGAWAVILKWADDHGRSHNNVLNSMIPALAFCLQNYTSVDKDGNPTVELNLGTITFKPSKKGLPWMRKKNQT